MSDTAELIEKLRALQSQLRARGVSSLHLFGSRARGDARPDSDVDLLVAPNRTQRFTLLDLAFVERLAEEQLGLTANASIADDLKPAFRARIADDLREVFGP